MGTDGREGSAAGLSLSGLIRVGGLFVGAGLLFMGAVVMCHLLCGHH